MTSLNLSEKSTLLLDYIEDELGQSGLVLKGILVGCGYRHELPEERGDQFTQACKEGATRQGYCLLATTELFSAVAGVLEDPSEKLKADIRENILNTTGVYQYTGFE